MFDVVTYALVKKLIGQAATGISGVEYKDGKLIFTLSDGSTIETALDISTGVAGARLNEEGALVIEFSDGSSLAYAAASKEDLRVLKEDVAALDKKLEKTETNLNEAIQTLSSSFEDLGLSVVDGCLNITYEGE